MQTARPANVQSPAADPAPQAAAANGPAVTIRDDVRPLSAEVRETRPAAATATANTATPATAPTQPPATQAAILPTPAEEAGFLPTLSELQLDQRIALSPLHIDVHVFNENPQRRFVLINSRKYKEGERLSEGPLLEEIRRDGLVMYYRGQRFLVPRD